MTKTCSCAQAPLSRVSCLSAWPAKTMAQPVSQTMPLMLNDTVCNASKSHWLAALLKMSDAESARKCAYLLTCFESVRTYRPALTCCSQLLCSAGTGGGGLELVEISGPIVKVRITGPAASVMTVRVAVTQKLREKFPAIAAVQLMN